VFDSSNGGKEKEGKKGSNVRNMAKEENQTPPQWPTYTRKEEKKRNNCRFQGRLPEQSKERRKVVNRPAGKQLMDRALHPGKKNYLALNNLRSEEGAVKKEEGGRGGDTQEVTGRDRKVMGKREDSISGCEDKKRSETTGRGEERWGLPQGERKAAMERATIKQGLGFFLQKNKS